MENYTDLYILYDGHPKYNDIQAIEDDIIRVIIQKYQMILFTNKGDMYGDLNFGANIYKYLHQTNVNGDYIKKELIKQIEEYIPEASNINYDINITFDQVPDDFQDRMFITFKISDYQINNFF
jgi:hypothetical protein